MEISLRIFEITKEKFLTTSFNATPFFSFNFKSSNEYRDYRIGKYQTVIKIAFAD